MDTSLKWTPSYCGHLSVPQAVFAGNEPLECGHLPILDCGHFFPVPSAVNNLWKVDTCWSSPYFFHSVKVNMHITEQKSFLLSVFMLSYFVLNLLTSRDMTWEFYFSMICTPYRNKTLMLYLYSIIKLMQHMIP
jgi:hypothetical protein